MAAEAHVDAEILAVFAKRTYPVVAPYLPANKDEWPKWFGILTCLLPPEMISDRSGAVVRLPAPKAEAVGKVDDEPPNAHIREPASVGSALVRDEKAPGGLKRASRGSKETIEAAGVVPEKKAKVGRKAVEKILPQVCLHFLTGASDGNNTLLLSV